MGLVEGMDEELQDELAFAFDIEPQFSMFEILQESALQPAAGGTTISLDDPDIHVMGSSPDYKNKISRRQSASKRTAASSDQRVPSKNLLSEQKRRRKLNDSLLALRSLVPNITKMDKASIISDTITHLKKLEGQIEELEKWDGKCDKQTESLCRSSCLQEDPNDHEVVGALQHNSQLHESLSSSPPSREEDQEWTNSIKVAVLKIEDEVYKLNITCQQQRISLVQLSRAVETLVIDVVCSSISATLSCSTAICVFIVKMSSWKNMALKDVEADILKLLETQ